MILTISFLVEYSFSRLQVLPEAEISQLPLYVNRTSNTAQTNSNTDWTKNAQQTILNIGSMFSMADEGLGTWNTDDGKNKIIKSISKAAGRLAGVFGAVGSLFAIILSFIPGREAESQVVKLMKEEFGKMSEKMDTIARSLEDTKDLIQMENQKSAYIQHEHNIHHGFDRMKACLSELDGVICNGQLECKRQKVAIAEGFASDLDIRKDVEAIYRGFTSDTTFGRSLLELLKEESKCNIPKLNLLTNKVMALITKGVSVSIFHDMLKHSTYSILDDSKLADKMFSVIENKRQAIEESCINNFEYYINLDLEGSHSEFSNDLQTTNTNLVFKLRKKYPWINWLVFTTSGDERPKVSSTFKRLVSSSKELEVHSFVIPTNDARVEYLDIKIQRWKELMSHTGYKGDFNTLEKEIEEDNVLAGQIQSYAFLYGNQRILGYMQGELKQQMLGDPALFVPHFNVFFNRPLYYQAELVVVSFRQILPKCSKSCNGNGKCFVYPYSTSVACRCDPGFSGESCTSSETSIQLQSVINSILKHTMKLPSLTSIQHTLEDVHMSLLTASDNIEDPITALGNKLDEKFKSLGEYMMSAFDWFAVLLKYNNAVDNLSYFNSIWSSKSYHFSEVENISIASLSHNTTTVGFSVVEEQDIVNFLLTPTGIQKWLHQFNFIVVGRRKSEFNAHKPLLFMLMEKYKHRICLQDYKDLLAKTYRQLMLLQLEGYIMWSKAFSVAQRDSSVIAKRYQNVLESQRQFLQSEACSVAIPLSKNLYNCTDGYLIHKSLDVEVQCQDGYFPKVVQKKKGKKFHYIVTKSFEGHLSYSSQLICHHLIAITYLFMFT